eukprot:2702480-Pyramimonas_sp.AAC.1
MPVRAAGGVAGLIPKLKHVKVSRSEVAPGRALRPRLMMARDDAVGFERSGPAIYCVHNCDLPRTDLHAVGDSIRTDCARCV